VIDAGSFHGAAEALHMSAAAVTRQVADLESHLDARLIHRTTRRLALTDVGEGYLERVREILVEVEEAEALASHAASEPSGVVRVLAPPAFAVHQIAKHLPRFRERYPRVALELTVPGPVLAIDETQDVSILVTGEEPLDGDFVARRLARSEGVICAAPDYLARRGVPQHPRELRVHEALLPGGARPAELSCRRGLGAGGEPIELHRAVPRASALQTHHLDTHYAAALAGLGIAGLPSFVAEDALQKGALVRLLPEWTAFTLTLYAALPARRHMPVRTRAFVDFLVETFGGEDRDPWLQPGCGTPPDGGGGASPAPEPSAQKV
jgi:DNA-binding transcriptional LysR family regulator